jgi:hypothetical protein
MINEKVKNIWMRVLKIALFLNKRNNNMSDNTAIIEDRKVEIRKRISKNNYRDEFYHYTSLSAFYNIIKSHQLWFGNAATMNDKNEGKEFICDLKKALLDNLQDDKKECCTDFFNKVCNRIDNESTYLMSLSFLKDDVGQWERYADNARGIRIGFNAENFWLAFYYPDFIINKVFMMGI